MTKGSATQTTGVSHLRQAANRNPGMAFDHRWLAEVRVNLSAVQRRVATLAGRRTVKQAWQSAWLLKAVSLMDLTTLSGDDTAERVRRLCAKARQPVRRNVLQALGAEDIPLTTGGVCVYPAMLPAAREALTGSGIPLAVVAAGFPAGLSDAHIRREEVRRAAEAGADEIDIVINRGLALNGDWQGLFDEVRGFVQAAGAARVKAIIATGQLATGRNIARASLTCMMAGADFVKTSTGMEPKNATLEAALIMLRTIRDYHRRAGVTVGFKPAGGIASAGDALRYLMLVKEELGNAWLTPRWLRLGASSLLTDIERQLEHRASGRYAAGYRQPIG